MANRLERELESRGGLSEVQHGFKRGRSRLSAVEAGGQARKGEDPEDTQFVMPKEA